MAASILIGVAAFFRSGAVSLGAILFATQAFHTGDIGLLVAIGLAGGTFATVVVTKRADRLGRRATLTALALLAAAGGIGIAREPGFWMLAAAVFFGMFNGMGRDRCAAYALEQAALAGGGTRAIAWYHSTADIGAALGSLAAALGPHAGWYLYAGAMGAGVLIYPMLPRSVEVAAPRAEISPASRRRIAGFAGISMIDSLGSGFLTGTLMSLFFMEWFGVPIRDVAGLFCMSRLANAAGNIIAARLAARYGLIHTAVFAHMAGGLLLIAVPFMPNFWVAAAVYLVRELLVEMDVPTRNAYLTSIVSPEERTAALGTAQLTRTAMWTVCPGLAGWAMRTLAISSPLFIGAGIKVVYDWVLWFSFRRTPPADTIATG